MRKERKTTMSCSTLALDRLMLSRSDVTIDVGMQGMHADLRAK